MCTFFPCPFMAFIDILPALIQNSQMRTNNQLLSTFNPNPSVQNSKNQMKPNCYNSFRNSVATDRFDYSNLRNSSSWRQNLRNSLNTEGPQKLEAKYKRNEVQNQRLFSSNLKQTLADLQKKLAKAKGELNRYYTRNSKSEPVPKIKIVIKDVKDQNLLYQSLATTASGSSKFQNENNPKNKNASSNNAFPKLKNYYLCHLEEAFQGNDVRALEHLKLSIKVLKYYFNINSPSFIEIQSRKVNLVKRKQDAAKKTLVIDVDKTLLRCQDKPGPQYDIMIPIQVNKGVTSNVYIKIRPYAISFLKKMSKYFEIIAFTSGHQTFIDPILDELDPNNEYIRHRLYKKNCILLYENLYTKDLRIINRDLSSMMLVDNTPYSYIFQPQNGIPILPYHSGEDKQLAHLQKYLLELVQAKDVREVNKKTFKLHRYCNFKEEKELVKELYVKEQ